jgi:hypothetical protein
MKYKKQLSPGGKAAEFTAAVLLMTQPKDRTLLLQCQNFAFQLGRSNYFTVL